ncbi:MAG TPA: symmetrical bis(5'-nucleosyl)-tetraphosphatase, partial [Gammaproteobacteria bacterium]|nr:symmetrical bis(5'-nucleosyl)-tetraphosphatase [Gammaproteobacteria bacterium]
TYAIGDVQGCYEELCALLDLIRFDPAKDRLCFAGDLVNRGPSSLEVLRLVAGLGDRALNVLGNHDLHLIAAAEQVRVRKGDTLHEILQAEDKDRLLQWLVRCPVMYRDPRLDFCMVHAGLVPQWSADDAMRLAGELESCLRGPGLDDYLAAMYGGQPDLWREDLEGQDRLRFLTNVFTRLRFCRSDGSLDLEEKGVPGEQPAGLYPWYAHPDRRSRGAKIVFGHWAALQISEAEENEHGVYHIDQGCIWGGSLTALRMDDMRRFSVPSRQPKRG